MQQSLPTKGMTAWKDQKDTEEFKCCLQGSHHLWVTTCYFQHPQSLGRDTNGQYCSCKRWETATSGSFAEESRYKGVWSPPHSVQGNLVGHLQISWPSIRSTSNPKGVSEKDISCPGVMTELCFNSGPLWHPSTGLCHRHFKQHWEAASYFLTFSY